MRLLAVVAVELVLVGCGPPESASGPLQNHRLIGVWNSLGFGDHDGNFDLDITLPTTDEEWNVFLQEPEASFSQTIIRADGTLIMGGLMLGHQLADKYTWEILKEEADRVSLRTIDDQGRVDDSMTIFFEDADTMYMPHPGDSRRRMYFRRADRVAPVPWLRD